jgi:ubiquinone/menaquinone biosynthesis C-methylase UbiE
MSGFVPEKKWPFVPEKKWHLGIYYYVFYRYIIEQYCLKIFRKPCLMLDAGCGPRICSLSHVPKNIRMVGIDVSHKNIVDSNRKAKKVYGNFDFIVASIMYLPFQNNTFGLAICIDVLEHIRNKQHAINEIHRICKPGVMFVGSTSNLMNPLLLFDSTAPKRVVKTLTDKFAPGHYERSIRFYYYTLSQAFNRAGYKVYDIKVVGFPPFQPWQYQLSDKKLPWYAYFWIIFNKLTKKKPFYLLNEVMIFRAIK